MTVAAAQHGIATGGCLCGAVSCEDTYQALNERIQHLVANPTAPT
jgi:hypothetical protein